MLLGFLAFGTIWFWVLCVLGLLVAMALVETDKPFWTIVSLGVVGGFIFAANKEYLMPLLDPTFLFAVFVGYLICGLGWSFVKWAMFVQDERRKFIEYKDRIMHSLNLDAEGFQKHYQADWRARDEYKRPTASRHKRKIVNWMAYWPLSIINFAIFDFLSKVFRELYNRFSSLYERISKEIYPDDPADMLKTK